MELSLKKLSLKSELDWAYVICKVQMQSTNNAEERYFTVGVLMVLKKKLYFLNSETFYQKEKSFRNIFDNISY